MGLCRGISAVATEGPARPAHKLVACAASVLELGSLPASALPRRVVLCLPQDAAAKTQRVHACTSNDSLRAVVERLAVPGVRRLVVVHPDTRRVSLAQGK